MNNKINKAGIDLIKSCEGLKLYAYQDSVGIWTVGYGHTTGAYAGQVISVDEAEDLLERDLTTFEYCVGQLLTRPVNSNQFSALVSFAFNVGIGALKRSSLLQDVNQGKFKEAADEFLKWSHAGGKEIEGLKNRRIAERELFLKPESIEDDINRNTHGSGAV